MQWQDHKFSCGKKKGGNRLTSIFFYECPPYYEFSEYPADDDDAGDDDMPTDAEASRFTFLERLEHYMEKSNASP